MTEITKKGFKSLSFLMQAMLYYVVVFIITV